MDTSIVLTPELVAGIFGFLLSVFFTYFPKVNTAFAKLTTEQKSLIQILGTIAVAAIIFLISCQGWITINIACTEKGAVELIKIVFVALTSNQITYLSTKNFMPNSVKEAKAGRMLEGQTEDTPVG